MNQIVKAFFRGFFDTLDRFYSPTELLDFIISFVGHLIIFTILIVQTAPALLIFAFGTYAFNVLISYILRKYKDDYRLIFFRGALYLFVAIVCLIDVFCF